MTRRFLLSSVVRRALTGILGLTLAAAVPASSFGSGLTILHSFGGTPGPAAPLIQGTDSNFYGTTLKGGDVLRVVEN
jgi:hypothetical protein